MADSILHIKDSYYFEVPKLLYPYDYRSRRQFPDVWVSLDPEYQEWEAERLYEELAGRDAALPGKEKTLEDWHHWVHADHANFAKPLKGFLEEKYLGYYQKFEAWKAAELAAARADKSKSVEDAKRLNFNDYLKTIESTDAPDKDYFDFLRWMEKNSHVAERTKLLGSMAASEGKWERAKSEARNIKEWKDNREIPEWSKDKLAAYNGHLSGKILIPQPFATLRNFYEKESGFAISKYLLIEIFVSLVLVLLFSKFAQVITDGRQAKGKFWNLIEVFLVFIRDQIVRPTLGGHHEEDTHHPEHGHEYGGPYAEHGQAVDEHGHPRAEKKVHAAAAHGHDHHHDPATRFLPLLWTIFFFVLGCNLMGMLPWAGAPTAAFAVTLAMACVTLLTVVAAGMMQFGVGGFFLNQIPGMDLPWYMAIIIKPMILAIELLGLMIKHGVLAVRLFANLVAGHLVLLGIMGFAFGMEAALRFTAPGAANWQWAATAVMAVVSSAVFSCLELFVAFLQAYIFTFLSALFIGAAIHKH